MDNTISDTTILMHNSTLTQFFETGHSPNRSLPGVEIKPEIEEAVKVTISKEAVDKSNTLTSFLTETSSEIKVSAIAPVHQTPSILSRDEVKNLFSTSLNLGRKGTLRLYNFLIAPGNVDIDYGNLFSALTAAKDDAVDMIKHLPKLGHETRNLFLSIAFRGVKDISSGLLKISKMLGDSSLQNDFLSIADELSDEELADFIQAALDNPDAIAGMVRKTKELDGVDRKNFLGAAGESPDLKLLISKIDDLEENNLSQFLFAADKAGSEQDKLITLSNRLSDKDFKKDILAMASFLSREEFENYIVAAKNAKGKSTALRNLTSTLDKSQRTLFLSAAANTGKKTTQLISLVSDLAKSSSDLDNFLNTAHRTRDVEGLISITSDSGHNRSSLVAFASELHSADLQNFIGAAREMKTSTLNNFIQQGNKLSGIEQSHFLFGAIKAEKSQDDYLSLTKSLDGEDKKNLLFIVANSDNKQANLIIHKTANISKDENRTKFLADTGFDIASSEKKKHESRYIHLSHFLGADEFDNLLKTIDFAGSEVKVDQLLETSDIVKDRASFFATAADSNTQVHGLLEMTNRLDEDTQEQFLETANKLSGKGLQNFLKTAGQSGSDLDEFIALTDSLSGQERVNFLKASVYAQKQDVLGELIDLTNIIGGPGRSLFLTTAADADGHLGNFIEATNNFILAEKDKFMTEAEKSDFNLTSLFENDSKVKYILREKYKNDISQFVRAAEATGFDIKSLFSHDTTGYHFKNEENSEYIGKFIRKAGSSGFDLIGRFVLRDFSDSGKKLAGTTSGGIEQFMENALASKHLLSSYIKPYLA